MNAVVSEDIKKSFDADGFYVWKNFISAEHAEELRELAIDMAAHERTVGDSYFYPFDDEGLTQRVWNLTNKSTRFRELLEMDAISEMMDHIFRRPTHHQLFHLSSFQANILYPGAKSQKLHIDTPFPEPIPPWPAKANSIWLLDDFTNQNGATEVVAGTHKLDHKPTKDDDANIEFSKAIAPKGSVLFTHGNLWHRAGANNSDKPRVALLCSFAASYMKEIASEEDQSLIVSGEVKDQASDRLKAILGVGHGIKDGAFVSHAAETDTADLGHYSGV